MGIESHPPISILIVDDQAQFRHGLRVALGADDANLVVVGEAADGEEAITMAQDLRPDVVILDVRMPGVGGINAATALSAVAPGTHILMLTVSDDPADIDAALAAGAAGYLLKERSLEEIADAVIALADGKRWPAKT
jgi:two-component system NarL family response regulator